VKSVAFDAAVRFQAAACRCTAYGAQGEELAVLQATSARLAAYPVTGLLEARQQLAAAATESGAYPF